MNDEQRNNLMKAIGRMLLPLVSPYDLSEKQLLNQNCNNPFFRQAEEQVFHLVTSNPLTLEKVLNDMKIMQEVCLAK